MKSTLTEKDSALIKRINRSLRQVRGGLPIRSRMTLAQVAKALDALIEQNKVSND